MSFLRAWSFTLCILTALATGLAFPGMFIGVGNFHFTSLFTPLLMLIMFSMEATLNVGEFATVSRIPVAVAVGLVCQFTIMPLLVVACLVQNLGGYLLGYLASRALGQDRLTARTVAIEVGMQSCGLPSGLAATLGKVGTLGLAPIVFGRW